MNSGFAADRSLMTVTTNHENDAAQGSLFQRELPNGVRDSIGSAAGRFTLCPRFNERSDVEATTRLASEAMPTHNPYEPFTPFGAPPAHNSPTNRNWYQPIRKAVEQTSIPQLASSYAVTLPVHRAVLPLRPRIPGFPDGG